MESTGPSATARIQDMPVDIIIEVFWYLAEDRMTKYRLLLTCRAWRDAVTASPVLWRDIKLAISCSTPVSRLWDYAIKSQELSLPAELDIHIVAQDVPPRKLSALYGPGEYLQLEYEKRLHLAHYPPEGDCFWDLLPTSDHAESEKAYSFRLAIQMTLNLLRGPNDEHARRWRRFSLDLSIAHSSHTEMLGIWNSIDVRASNLRHLRFYLEPRTSLAPSRPATWKSTGFCSLAGLRGFETNLHLRVDELALRQDKLETLLIHEGRCAETFLLSGTSRFASLHMLELNFPVNVALPARTVAIFPLLTTLVLAGPHHHQVVAHIQAPNLHTLKIMETPLCSKYPPTTLFSSTVVDLWWNVLCHVSGWGWGRDLLRLVLSQLPGLASLRVRGEYYCMVEKENVIMLIAELVSKRGLLGNLHRVQLVQPMEAFGDETGVTTLTISDVQAAYLGNLVGA